MSLIQERAFLGDVGSGLAAGVMVAVMRARRLVREANVGCRDQDCGKPGGKSPLPVLVTRHEACVSGWDRILFSCSLLQTPDAFKSFPVI